MKDPGVERAAVSVTIGQTEEYMKVDRNSNTGESFRNFEGEGYSIQSLGLEGVHKDQNLICFI